MERDAEPQEAAPARRPGEAATDPRTRAEEGPPQGRLHEEGPAGLLSDDGDDPFDEHEDPMEEEPERLASNEEWVLQQADRMVARLPQRIGHDRRTEGEVFDRPALMTLHRLLSSGVLSSLDFPVSTGKEANVFRGTTPQGAHVAVKIYRINTATFRHVQQYIQGDERFQGVGGDKKTMVHAWAQKEFRNLHRMRDAGVDVPEPIKVLNNVLITEYLGVPEGPWPTLKDVGRLPDPKRFWTKLVDDYVAMVNKADLIHADLSEFNVLVEHADRLHDAAPDQVPRPRVIDVGQAVLHTHPHCQDFLRRDINNIVHYFRRQGLREAAPETITDRLRPEVRP